VWQEGLVGRPLLKRRGQAERLAARAGEIGSRLAALHGTDLRLPVEMTHASQVRMLERSLARAKALPADPARAAIGLGERLLAMADRFPEPATATLHGSFRLSHVMVTRRGLAFIDMDGANAGDAACDLGRFVAHVLRLGALGSIAPGPARHAVTGFCRGYRSEAAVPVGEDRIGWSSAAHVVSGGLDKAIKRLDPAALDALTAAAARICPT
jgi:aminoglycoside phosphotransferase (APT) family kinase protein